MLTLVTDALNFLFNYVRKFRVLKTGTGRELRMSDFKSKITDKHNHAAMLIECSHKHVYIMFCLKINVTVF